MNYKYNVSIIEPPLLHISVSFAFIITRNDIFSIIEIVSGYPYTSELIIKISTQSQDSFQALPLNSHNSFGIQNTLSTFYI